MENVTISVLNECWKNIVPVWLRGDGQEIQEIRNPPWLGQGRGDRMGKTVGQTEMRMVPLLNIEGLILDGPALFLSFYLPDMGSG